MPTGIMAYPTASHGGPSECGTPASYDCCARAASGHAAAAPPSSATNSRRPMPDMGGPSLRDYRIVSLPPRPRQVLGAGLSCSESKGCAYLRRADGEGAKEGGG